MFCPNCGNKLNGNEEFCSSCGNKLNNQSKNIKLNKIKIFIIILSIILFVSSLSVGITLFLKNDDKEVKIKDDVIEEEINEEDKISTLVQLKKDYESGVIDVNKYFTELVNYDYDYENLDEKYKTDEIIQTTGNISNIVDLLENHKSDISEDAIKKLLKKATLQEVSIGSGVSIEPQSNNISDEKIILLNDNKNKEQLSSHQLDKVYLSKNEHFLIWYTESGNDGITEEQLVDIADELENSIGDYEELFNIEYLYKPYYDELINKNYFKAREVLKDNGINAAKIDTAMNVYIYDTGSDSTLATYYNPYDSGILLQTIMLLGIDDLYLGESGIFSYPYIVLNMGIMEGSTENIKTVANHELFHHFQYLNCEGTNNRRCPNGYYTEATANVASVLVSEVTSTNNFLNGWAGRYTKDSSENLFDLGDGYGQFPYYYAYTKVVNNWSSILMPALNEVNPNSYIKNNTPREDLIKISEMVTYNTLAKQYDNKSLYTDINVTLKDTLNTAQTLDQAINAGAINYYEVSGDNTLIVTSGNKDYVGIKFYGYKDGVYTELVSSMDKLEVDLTFYVRYEKFYLAIYNADITTSNTYTIEVKNSDFEDNSEYITTFNNYNIDIEMDITIAGINTNTISTGTVDELHQKEYLEVTTTSMGLISVTNKLYYDFNSGYTYMTQPYGGDVWWKEKGTSQVVDLGNILDKLISMTDVTKIEENHYKIKMTKNDVNNLMQSSQSDASLISGDIFVEVYTENGYITKLEYDFTNMIEGFELFKTTIKYSNYDSAGDVEIPISIIDNAKEQ